MPLNFQPVALPLSGVDQKSHRLLRAPGVLDEAVNVHFRKLGSQVIAEKRLGYQRVDPDQVVGLTDSDALYLAVSTRGNELVAFTYDGVVALGDQNANLRGDDTLVYRGPNNRGACRVYHVGSSQLSSDYASEEGDDASP